MVKLIIIKNIVGSLLEVSIKHVIFSGCLTIHMSLKRRIILPATASLPMWNLLVVLYCGFLYPFHLIS